MEVGDFWQAGFDASWEVDIFGGVRRKIEAAEADLEGVKEDFQGVLVTLIGEVARNYVELRGLQKEIAIALRNIRSQEEVVALTRARFQAGVATELDVVRAQAQVASTQAQVPALEAGVERAMHRLSVLCGETPLSLRGDLAAEEPIPGSPSEVPLGLPSELLRRRPDIRRAENDLHAACARIGVAKADLFPRFFLNGSLGLESDRIQTLGNWGSRFWSMGPSVSWPVFAAGRVRSNIEVQDARHEAALLRYEEAVLGALEEVEDAITTQSRERERWRRLTISVESNRTALALANDLYRSGLRFFERPRCGEDGPPGGRGGGSKRAREFPGDGGAGKGIGRRVGGAGALSGLTSSAPEGRYPR